MKYSNIVEGTFLSRPNRFIAHVLIGGQEEIVHVKNTGRCRELLLPNARVYLEKAKNLERKTKYDLIAVMKNNRLVNMDSQMPNAGAYEWIQTGGLGFVPVSLKTEVRFGKSRFDLWYEKEDGKQGFVEVKGVTLEDNRVVRFPDAPTLRGMKHIKELEKCKIAGYEATVLFVVQMSDVDYFQPNYERMPEFGKQLMIAREKGVRILAVDCIVNPMEVVLNKEILVVLEENT